MIVREAAQSTRAADAKAGHCPGLSARVRVRTEARTAAGTARGPSRRLTATFRELTDKRDRLEGDVEKLRRRVAEAEGELDQLQPIS